MNTFRELNAAVTRSCSHSLPAGGRFGFPLDVYRGLETRTVPGEYQWNGLTRGGDPKHPSVLFQYTLAGFGNFRAGRNPPQRVEAGMAFVAVIPSDHEYELPEESKSWTFFWMMLHHPYIVQRLSAAQANVGPVISIDPAAPLTARAFELLDAVSRQTAADRFAHERMLFDFLLEYERHARNLLYPHDARQRMLERVRSFVLSGLDRPIVIAELAESVRMSRSNFSHAFKATTGLSPAKVITDLRLQEVKRFLLRTDDTLKAIARATGFADANHLCKVFRRQNHLSPGAFRKQMK